MSIFADLDVASDGVAPSSQRSPIAARVTYHAGFLNADLSFTPAQRATGEQMRRELFHSWYEYSAPETLHQELNRAIEALPDQFVFMHSQSVLDYALEALIVRSGKTCQTVTLQPADVDLRTISRWVEGQKFRYFLTHSQTAIVLHEAEKRLKEGENVVLGGPVPALHDLNWQGAARERGKDQAIVQSDAHWCVADLAKFVAPFRMRDFYPNLYPALALQGFFAFLREIDPCRNATLLRSLGIREVTGAALGRRLIPMDFLHKTQVQLAKEMDLPVIQRLEGRGRFYTMAKRYVS